MDLKLKELAEILQVSTKTIYRWINDNKIPYYRINHQYRFRTEEINQWTATSQHSINLLPTSAEEKPVTVLNSLLNGGIFYNIQGLDVEGILTDAVNKILLPSYLDKKDILSRLISREELASTGVGNGIAFPHPREPVIIDSNDESLCLFFLKNPVDYKALDNIPVKILFLILSSDQKRHLRLLSQLSHFCRQEDFVELLNSCPPRQNILSYIESHF